MLKDWLVLKIGVLLNSLAVCEREYLKYVGSYIINLVIVYTVLDKYDDRPMSWIYSCVFARDYILMNGYFSRKAMYLRSMKLILKELPRDTKHCHAQ